MSYCIFRYKIAAWSFKLKNSKYKDTSESFPFLYNNGKAQITWSNYSFVKSSSMLDVDSSFIGLDFWKGAWLIDCRSHASLTYKPQKVLNGANGVGILWSKLLACGWLLNTMWWWRIFFSSYHGHVAPSPECIMHSHPSTTAYAMLRKTKHPFVMNSTICFQLFFIFVKLNVQI